MKVLIACEESQIVTKAFRKEGHEAYSCDIQDCSGGKPEWHIKGDVTKVLSQHWDMIIAFPPCTYLTVAANGWLNVDRYGGKAIKRMIARREGINFFMLFANHQCSRVAIENPVGAMSSEYRKPDQIIQPYYFGDPFEKKTCLWLKGLPKLVATDIVDIPERRVSINGSGNTRAQWDYEASRLPHFERSVVRSKTFQGVATAMATQWGDIDLLDYEN